LGAKSERRKPCTFEKHRGCCPPPVVTGRNRKKEANKKAPGKKPGALHNEIVD
jgi:hypothetical protein